MTALFRSQPTTRGGEHVWRARSSLGVLTSFKQEADIGPLLLGYGSTGLPILLSLLSFYLLRPIRSYLCSRDARIILNQY